LAIKNSGGSKISALNLHNTTGGIMLKVSFTVITVVCVALSYLPSFSIVRYMIVITPIVVYVFTCFFCSCRLSFFSYWTTACPC